MLYNNLLWLGDPLLHSMLCSVANDWRWCFCAARRSSLKLSRTHSDRARRDHNKFRIPFFHSDSSSLIDRSIVLIVQNIKTYCFWLDNGGGDRGGACLEKCSAIKYDRRWSQQQSKSWVLAQRGGGEHRAIDRPSIDMMILSSWSRTFCGHHLMQVIASHLAIKMVGTRFTLSWYQMQPQLRWMGRHTPQA